MPIQERANDKLGAECRPGWTGISAQTLSRVHVGNLVTGTLLCAVAARLILIDQPYIDYWSWRQSDVAAIARNFLEHDFHFGLPQIDWAGGSAGYVGTEFPILPFLAALCYTFVGIHEWIGRTQSVIFFAISLPFFFLLVRQTFGGVAAVWAAFFYALAPLNLFAGRSFMPDVPSLSLAIIGLYFFQRWLRDSAMTSFYLAATAVSFSILIKVTSIVIAAPIFYLVVAEGADPVSFKPGQVLNSRTRHRGLQLVAFAAITILPSLAWYWHAYLVSEEFYPHHFFGAGGIRLESFFWYRGIAQQTVASGLTPILAVLALVGLFVAPRRKFGCLFDWWLVAMILFVVAVGYGNRHPWYRLPFVPIAAAFGGSGCAFLESKISSRTALVACSVVVASLFMVFSFLRIRPFYDPIGAQLRDVGFELKKLTPPDALVVAADNGNPAIFYYAERKGWHFLEKNGVFNGNPRDSQQAIADLERLHRQGATHVAFISNTFWWLQSYPGLAEYLYTSAALLEATPEFKIYKLTGTAR